METGQLLRQLMETAALSEEQAARALTIVASYAKERFPILEGTINSYVKQEVRSIDPDFFESLEN